MEEANNKATVVYRRFTAVTPTIFLCMFATVLNLTKNCGHMTGKVRQQECLHCPLL